MKAARRYPAVAALIAELTPSYPVYCIRPAALARAAKVFLDHFPGLVLYAVKCNPHPLVLRALHAAGIRHFDAASLPEVALVWELFEDAEAYFHNPVKSRAVIDTARRVYGVASYVVDHPAELAKVLEVIGPAPEPRPVIMVRLKTAGGWASYDLSAKFGASPEVACMLLQEVHRRGFACGLAFHVGSQCTRPEAYTVALRLAGEVIATAGVPLAFLNVGGGFPAAYPGVAAPPPETFIEVIRDGVAALALDPATRLMCEPGRALVADAVSLLVQVHLRKDDTLYINDGVYGSLSETVTAGLEPRVTLHRLDGPPASGELAAFTIYGPTCDNTDVLPRPFFLPAEVREGDWLEFAQMGAYSNALATRFNGFFPETFVEVAD